MQIEVKRFEFGDHWTIGRMFIDGKEFCYTLEPKVRPPEEPKVPKCTAIPYGTYTLTHSMSGHFGCDMPLLVGVPNFSEVRIHQGNTDAATEGCILVGSTWNGGDFVGNSVVAFKAFKARFEDAGSAGTITIMDAA